MPSTSSDAPAAAGSGTGALVPRNKLRDGNAQERERMWAIGIGYEPGQEKKYPERTPEGIMAWLKANPEVRTDSPAFPIPNDPNEKPEDRHWLFEGTLAYTVLKRPSAWKTPGLLEEVLRRIPDFERKDKNGKTLMQILKKYRKKEALVEIDKEIQRRVAEKAAEKEYNESVRRALIGYERPPLPAPAWMASSSSSSAAPDLPNPPRQLSPEAISNITSFAIGQRMKPDELQSEALKKVQTERSGKGRRKAHRTRRNKSRRRGAQR